VLLRSRWRQKILKKLRSVKIKEPSVVQAKRKRRNTSTRRIAREAERKKKNSMTMIVMIGTIGAVVRTNITRRKRKERRNHMIADPDHTRNSTAGTMVDVYWTFSFY